MVEIITREFIQMAGSAGEVRTHHIFALLLHSKQKVEHFHFPHVHLDGAGESQDSA